MSAWFRSAPKCGLKLTYGAVAVFAGLASGAVPLAAQQSGAQSGAPVVENAQPLEQQAQTGAVVLRGNVVDPDGAEIPGATVTLTPATGKAFSVTSGADGMYALRGVPPGTYALTVTMQGFASFVRQGLRIGEAPQTVNAKLALQTQQTVVTVSTDDNHVSVDQDSNASQSVLKGKDLDALSDDPDELQQELTALAGPAAGPNGGQIYIDGFTGGQLPPKSSIREIRINQNPFSAQYDKPGFGRVEVFTKPGTDKLHGSIQLNGIDKAFNTGSVFIAPGTFQPDYHTIFAFGSVTGPISKKASYSVGGYYRDIQDNAVVRPPAIYATSSNSGSFCLPNTPGCSIFTNYNFVQFEPQTRYEIAPRLDFALGDKNTLTARFQFERNTLQNQGIGGSLLPSAGYNNTNQETTLQLSDTQIFSAKVINETRFEYQRPTTTITPLSTAATINVQGGFSGGGSSAQSSNTTENHIEVQNYTSIALAKHFIRLGGRLRSTGETETTTANANGDFTYTSIGNYTTNNLTDYQVTNIVQPTVSTTTTDVGLYAEDDWKIRPNFTFTYGLRYETQNFIRDHKDFAPRLSGAYGVGKRTVIRAGAGIFYDRFQLGNQLNVVRNNGVNQQQFTLSAASATTPNTIPAGCGPGTQTSCVISGASSRLSENVIEIDQPAPFTNIRAPYQLQFNAGVDEQLFKGATLSVNYQHIRGVHQFNSDVPNALTAAGSTNPLLYQYQSNGVFNQNQLITNVRYSSRHGTVGSYYVLNYAKSDTGGAGSFASVPNDLGADYGRASFDTRSRLFLFGSFNLPHLTTVSPFLVAQSGTPYNITSGQDIGDDTFNQRAVFAPAGTVPTAANGVKTIAGCGTFAPPGTGGNLAPVPINSCTGPANFTLNLRITKTFGFGETRAATPGQDSGSRGGNGPPGGSGRGSGGSGRGGPGGPGGFGGGASSGKRYNLAIGGQVQNVFNIADRATPVGVLTSPLFGTSTELAGSLYTTDSAIRRITLQVTFSF